ncbi:hypothetical protein B0H14DRAFT_3498766 [Mycena olivaceomarginata]|nr:hypothetical protein B0H14DRAFT_3498766 [Mycena olivaceomarginata]
MLTPVLVPPHSEPTGGAFWSRRLRDPAHAPGVIISPRARPPPDLVASTRAGGTPLLSPPPVLAEVEEGAEDAVVEREAPPVLILHVKGFCYDTAVGGVAKVGKRVAFGPELGVGDGSPSSEALMYHHAVSSSGGHYTLDVLHPTRFPGSSAGTGSEREGWVRIADELVSDVRPPDVFSAPEGDSQCGSTAGRHQHAETAVNLIAQRSQDALLNETPPPALS